MKPEHTSYAASPTITEFMGEISLAGSVPMLPTPPSRGRSGSNSPPLRSPSVLPLNIHHVAIAVADLDTAVAEHERLYGVEPVSMREGLPRWGPGRGAPDRAR